MNTIIITTKDYNLFANSENWEKLDCSFFNEYLDTLLSQNDLTIQEFYANEACMTSFWVVRNQPVPELMLLRRYSLNDTVIYVLPCIPKYFIDLDTDADMHMNKIQCQDYLFSIIKQVSLFETNISNENLVLLAHDRDLGIKGNRVMRIRDRQKNSKLDTMLSDGTLSINNVFAFQHEDNLQSYTIVKSLLKDNLESDLFSTCISMLNNSAQEQEKQEKG